MTGAIEIRERVKRGFFQISLFHRMYHIFKLPFKGNLFGNLFFLLSRKTLSQEFTVQYQCNFDQCTVQERRTLSKDVFDSWPKLGDVW